MAGVAQKRLHAFLNGDMRTIGCGKGNHDLPKFKVIQQLARRIRDRVTSLGKGFRNAFLQSDVVISVLRCFLQRFAGGSDELRHS